MTGRSAGGTQAPTGLWSTLRYRTRSRVVRFVVVEPTRDGRAWVVVDTCGPDRRVVERLQAPDDGVEQALAVARDYRSEAEFFGGPLVARQPSSEEAQAA